MKLRQISPNLWRKLTQTRVALITGTITSASSEWEINKL